MRVLTFRKEDHEPLFWGDTPAPSSLEGPEVFVSREGDMINKDIEVYVPIKDKGKDSKDRGLVGVRGRRDEASAWQITPPTRFRHGGQGLVVEGQNNPPLEAFRCGMSFQSTTDHLVAF